MVFLWVGVVFLGGSLVFGALGHVFVLCWFGLALGAIWCGFLDFVLSCGVGII